MNKFLIKVALNAQKAREMAKRVGIIPDHLSQWKWGLRHLRDNRGEALTGKALEKAKIKRLGAMSEKSWDKLKKITSKVGPGIETAAIVDKTGRIRKIRAGTEPGYAPLDAKFFSHIKKTDGSFLHTHPDFRKSKELRKEVAIAKKQDPSVKYELENRLSSSNKHRNASSSGSLTHAKQNPKSMAEKKKQIKYILKNHPKIKAKLEKALRDPTDKDMQKYMKVATREGEKYKGITLNDRTNDFSTMAKYRLNKNYSIASPHVKTEAVHKVRGVPSGEKDMAGGSVPYVFGHRTVYLKHK